MNEQMLRITIAAKTFKLDAIFWPDRKMLQSGNAKLNGKKTFQKKISKSKKKNKFRDRQLGKCFREIEPGNRKTW